MKTARPPHRLLALSLGLLLATPSGLFAQSQLRSRLIERARDSRDSAPASVTEIMESETAQKALDAVETQVGEQLKGQSTEDLIRSAQQRIQRSREEAPTAAPAAESAPAAAPMAQPITAQPLIPDPVASNPRDTAPAPPAGQLLTQVDPAPANTPPPIMTPADIPPPVPLQPRYEKEKGNDSQVMEIEADESVMDNENRVITFTGQVVVTEPRFTLTSDRLEVWMHDDTNLDGSATDGAAPVDSDRPPFKRAIATGGMVEIEKIGADGKLQIAKARQADYDATTGDIVLKGGPPTLQSGSGFVNPSSPDAVIVLRADGNHKIDSGTGRASITIPLNKPASANAGGGLPTGNLDSITNRGSN